MQQRKLSIDVCISFGPTAEPQVAELQLASLSVQRTPGLTPKELGTLLQLFAFHLSRVATGVPFRGIQLYTAL